MNIGTTDCLIENTQNDKADGIFYSAADVEKIVEDAEKRARLKQQENIQKLLELSMLWVIPNYREEKMRIWRQYCPTAPMTAENMLHAIYNAALPIKMKNINNT